MNVSEPTRSGPTPMQVDLGIFAHNEAETIGVTIRDLARQDILADTAISIRVVLLANACTDATVDIVRREATGTPLDQVLHIFETPEGGKSRTWNTFVHTESRPGAEILLFCDADIGLPETDTLDCLVRTLTDRPALLGTSSRPVKDIEIAPDEHGLTERLIAAGAGSNDNWRRAICGQLYALTSRAARRFHIPIGLPVEDGFVRAAVTTACFTIPEDVSVLDGSETYHVYESERSIAGLVRHQVRIVIGGAVNLCVFKHLDTRGPDDIRAELAAAATDEGWLKRIVNTYTPEWPFGWVPLHFLVKRVALISKSPGKLKSPKGLIILVVGFGFDALTYVIAQFKMARGNNAGFW